MQQKRYEVRIVGGLDEGAVDAFAGYEVVFDGKLTLIYATLDNAGLHGLLERIRSLGLELLDMRQMRPRRSSGAGFPRPVQNPTGPDSTS